MQNDNMPKTILLVFLERANGLISLLVSIFTKETTIPHREKMPMQISSAIHPLLKCKTVLFVVIEPTILPRISPTTVPAKV